MKAVMYHYVRPAVDREPDYYYLSVADFRRQLDYFESEFGFVEREAFVESVRSPGSEPPSGVVLTFDDGFRDHYETVFQELRDRGLWGIFYVPVGPYLDEKLLDVHRTHVLLGRYSGTTLCEELTDIVTEEMVPYKRRTEFRDETYRTQDDVDEVKQAKRLLNYFVAPEHQTAVLDRLEGALGSDPTPVDEFYLTVPELRAMQTDGMLVGSHTVSHPVLSKLSARRQESEIAESFSFLSEHVGSSPIRSFCYPYGGSHSFTPETKSILESHGCEFAFTVESRDVSAADLDGSALELPRYDCNEFPHGDASGTVA